MADITQEQIDDMQDGLIDQATEGAQEVVVGENRLRMSNPLDRYELINNLKSDAQVSSDNRGAFLKTTFKSI